MKEARIEWTDLGEVTSDRKGWKSRVMERMKKLDIWEKSRGHKWTGERVEQRNEGRSMYEGVQVEGWFNGSQEENA